VIALHSVDPLAPPRLPELITAVLEADEQDENDWVEWKSTLDLTQPRGLVHVSRAILGFANRDPQNGQQPFGGTAYLLIGVTPGTLQGVEPVDFEKLQPKLARYLGTPGPSWRHHYVPPAEDPALRVLVIEVPAPKPGQYPYPWHTDYQPADRTETRAASGTLFVRRGSRTERANYGEVLMLAARAAQGAAPRRLTDLGLEVTVLNSAAPLRTASVPDAAIEEWLERRRQVLLAPTVPDARRALGFSRLLSDSDIRTYSREVDAYLEKCRPLVKGVIVAAMMRDGMNGFLVNVTNLSDDHLADVEVRVVLPPWCTVIEPGRLGRHVLPEPPPSPLTAVGGLFAAQDRVQRGALSHRRLTTADSTRPPQFHASSRLVDEGSRKVYRESLGMVRPRSHRHTCTVQLLLTSDVEDLNLTITVTSPSFPGVVDLVELAPVVRPSAALIDELLDPDPIKAMVERAPRFPTDHQH